MGAIVPWKCDGCGEPVLAGAANEKAYVHISKVDVGVHEVSAQQWQAELHERLRSSAINMGQEEFEGGTVEFMLVDMGDIISAGAPPPVVEWQVHHFRCDPDQEAMDFFIPIEQVRTFAQLLRAALSVQRNAEWIEHTNWADFIFNITEGN